MKVGDMVKVLGISDDSDSSGLKAFVGRVGRIVEVGVLGLTGESEGDPFFVVEVLVLGRDGFWGEELQVLVAEA